MIWGMIVAAQRTANKNIGSELAIPVTDGDWIAGNASSSVTIVEYSDFQCPACAAYYFLIEKMLKDYGDHFRYVYRHFPLSQHQNAIPASLASEAAGRQGKFWEMYSLLFTKHDEWESSVDAKTIFAQYAKDLKLDIDKYNADIDSKELLKKILDQEDGGVRSKIDSTPTLFLNGKKISNPQSVESFKRLIDEASNK